MESVKSQALQQEESELNNHVKTKKNGNYHLESVIPRVFQNSKRDFMTHKNGRALPKGFEGFVN